MTSPFYPIHSDHRYTITQEYTGDQSRKAQYVVRFCGEWITSRQFLSAAVLAAQGAKNIRNGALVVEEKTFDPIPEIPAA